MSGGKLVLTWWNFEQWMGSLVTKLQREHPQLKAVYGPERGGSVPAVVLSHRLKLEYLDWAEVQAFTLGGKPKYAPNEVLVVDEIVDSGETLAGILDTLPRGVVTACWVAKAGPMSQFPALIAHMSFPENNNDWLIFPWEDRRGWEADKEGYASRQ